MLERFNQMSPVMRVITVMIALIVLWTVIRLVLGLLQMLMPLMFVAAIIVAVLWVYEKIRDAS